MKANEGEWEEEPGHPVYGADTVGPLATLQHLQVPVLRTAYQAVPELGQAALVGEVTVMGGRGRVQAPVTWPVVVMLLLLLLVVL